MDEKTFIRLAEQAKTRRFSSMNYIGFEDCANAELLCDDADGILLIDRTTSPAMLYYAADNFNSLTGRIDAIPGSSRIHFVPRASVPRLKSLGFTEWSEFVDFFNPSLADTAARISPLSETEFLAARDCGKAAALSQNCRLQSRGFEGETAPWFTQWIAKNKVILVRSGEEIAGFCCVALYNEGKTLWIREIAVDPACQRQGFGKALMERAIRYGAAHKAVKGFLAADVRNYSAVALYRQFDFAADVSDSEIQMIRDI